MVERIFVTGVGVVSSVGLGRAQFFRALQAGTSGISEVTAFDGAAIGRKYAGEVKAFEPRDHLSRAEQVRVGRCAAMAVAAARMALADTEMDHAEIAGPRTAVVLGTTMGEARILAALDSQWIHGGASALTRAQLPRYGSTLLPIHVARAVGARGIVLSLPAACAAGNYAIGIAADLIRSGRADVAITGAAELIQELQFTGFVRLAAMAPLRCQPFDLNRQGLLLGEGAGVLVLESESHAQRRGARLRAEVGGYGLSCDAYHITRPHPDASGSIAALRAALDCAGVSAADVDFVNAHGTGTRHNDAAEAKVVREVFGERRIPISSMKSMLGHCMGAASALEAIGCVFTIETGVYPPTIGYETPDPECDVNVVANAAGHGKSDIVVNNSLAFGGYNAVTVLARPGVLPSPRQAGTGTGR